MDSPASVQAVPVPPAAEPLNYIAAARQGRQAEYGERWGEGAARYFSIEADFLDEDQSIRLMPVPESFFCPISATIMSDPVATVDGCAYERDYIERWFRERRQANQAITSPTTGLPLPSTTLMPLLALQRAIEAYLAHRPELRRDHMAGRSFEEAAQVLQSDLLEKHAMNTNMGDEVRRLRGANKALLRQLRQCEGEKAKLVQQLQQARWQLGIAEEPSFKEIAEGVLPSSSDESTAFTCVEAEPQERSIAGQGEQDLSRLQLQLARSEQARPKSSKITGRAHRQLLSLAAVLAAMAGVLHFSKSDPPGIVHEMGSVKPVELSPLPEPDMPEISNLIGTPMRSNVFPVLGHKIPRGRSPELIYYVEQLRSRNKEERHQALMSLLATARGGIDMRNAIMQAGAVLPLVELLREMAAPGIQEAAAAALGILCADGEAAQSTLLRAGAVPALVRLLGSDAPVPTRAAASALRNLAANHNQAQLAIAQAGAVAPLIHLLSHSDRQLQAQAASALGNLAGDSSENHFDKQVMIAQAGALTPLVRLLRTTDSAEVREACASALRMLATNNADNQVAVAHAGAIQPLVQLLRDEAPSVREEAAAALGNLVFFNDETNAGNQAAIAEAGAVPHLAALLKDPKAQVTAAGALRNLAAQNVANQEAICRDALQSLVQLVTDGKPKAQVEAAGAIHNLAAGNAKSQQLIVEAGALEPLVALLKEEAPRVREVAAGALWALARAH